MSTNDKDRLIDVNKFLKKQNQAVMKMLEGYAALHFYYQQLFTKRTQDQCLISGKDQWWFFQYYEFFK